MVDMSPFFGSTLARAPVNIMDTRAISRNDMGFYIGVLLIYDPCSLGWLDILTVGHAAKHLKETFFRSSPPLGTGLHAMLCTESSNSSLLSLGFSAACCVCFSVSRKPEKYTVQWHTLFTLLASGLLLCHHEPQEMHTFLGVTDKPRSFGSWQARQRKGSRLASGQKQPRSLHCL